MKTKRILLNGMLVAAIAGMVLTSCKKEEKEDQDTSTASENAVAEQTFDDASNISDEAANGSVSSFKQGNPDAILLSSCAQVRLDTASNANPDTITVTFGTGTYPALSNCLCADGRYRRGQIIITYSGRYRDSASTHTISFNNFYVNDNQVLGTKTVTNMGHNSAGHLTFNVAVSGQIILAGNGGTITWNSTRTREWLSGENTPIIRIDDVYGITGSADGTGTKGNSFTATITKQLKVKLDCRWITEGIIDITPSGKATRTINFGDGSCDNKATITIKGKISTITMK